VSEERKTLIQSLKDTIVFFKERKTVGRMKTEHSIFIPTELMRDKSEETEEFIRAAKAINNHPEWFCPVAAEKVAVGKVAGVEFVFSFNEDTKFDDIIEEIEQRLEN
jgi:hypothetical protein